MKGKWYAIAKAEFLVLTSRFHRRRTKLTAIVLPLSLGWALLVAPLLTLLILEHIGRGFDLVLILGFPGIMRSLIMALWMIIIGFPITNALSRIQIGQWEILLSNNARTRDILVGTFAGSVPVYGLTVLVFGPTILAPFIVVYKVTVLGQALLYLLLLFVSVGALWFSTLLCTALRAKLGSSPRGDDLARALIVVLALIGVVSVYGFLFFGGSIIHFFGLEFNRVFPFTWGADTLIWLVLLFSDSELSSSFIASVESMLGFNLPTNVALLSVFTLAIVAVGVSSADRLFAIRDIRRSEQVISTGDENLILQAIRRVLPGPSGVLLVTVMKDFGRKAQNISKLVYGMVMAVVLPLMIRVGVAGFTDPEGLFVVSSLVVSVMLSLAGGMTFGGIGFLDSKDQLWILESAPSGIVKYVKARIVESMLFALPMALIASIMVSFIVGLGVMESILVVTCAYLSLLGAVMIATGVTANSPNYEDTKSKAFKDNTGTTVICIMGIYQLTLLLIIEMGPRNPLIMIFAPGILLLVTGVVLTIIGTKRLSRPE